MVEFIAFLKSNKYFIGVLVLAAFLVLILVYGYAEKSAGASQVVAEVNKTTVTAIRHNEQIGIKAVDQSVKDTNKSIADSLSFDKKQGAKEAAIQKKYTTEKISTFTNGKQSVVEVTVPLPPATVPNGMEKEISDSRIDDAWNRYCHFKQQDGQPCEQ